MNKEYKISQYKDLLGCQSLGFYNCCEMFSVFLTNRKNNSAYNFFTIFNFDEKIEPEMSEYCLTDKLIHISSEYSMGIIHKTLPLNCIDKIFNNICASENSDYIDIGNGPLLIGNLEFIPKVFVPQNSTITIMMNKVLKNNFRNGSYTLEFFDVTKNCKSMLRKKDIKKITDELYRIIPVDLFTITDRIGNFIFQFPSLNVNAHYTTDKNELELNYNIQFDDRLCNKSQYQVISELIYDNNIVGFGTAICDLPKSNIKFDVGDASQMCRTTIIDNQSQLILSRQETTFMRQITVSTAMSTVYGEQRLMFDDNNNVVKEIDVNSVSLFSTEEPVVRLRKQFIDNRQYNKRIEELLDRREFRRYGIKTERQKALDDIRYLINLANSGKVYIWDPYLSARDILETWYYNKTFGVKLYAITSKDAAGGDNLRDWISREAHLLENRSNNYGIKLEFRCQCNGHGYAFHDRFLMLLRRNERPKVWSLGTSINNIGNKHHIIQEVQHPRMIIDAFEELWDMLSYDECLIWRK